MKGFSLIYEICKVIVMPSVRIFYKKIQIKNFKNVPAKGAVFICSNHVNAFVDPVSVQLHSMRQIYSLARGDAFKKPFMRWLFTKWKLIPIYRISEGIENLKKNEQTFLLSCEVLTKGNPLVIYPEGICIQERRLRKLKKGAARIVFGVEEQSDFKANLLILPVGLIYSEPKKFRSNLFMNFGEPITATKYAELFKQDKPRALNELTADIEIAMKRLVVNIQHKENDQLVEHLYLVYKQQLTLDLGLDPDNLEDDFKISCDIANAVNYFQTNEPQLVATVKQKASTYIKALNELNIHDQLITPKGLQTINVLRIVLDVLLLIISMPLFLIGLIMNYPPYKLGGKTADARAKEVEFHASINMTLSWLGWIIYYLLQLMIVALLFRSWFLLGFYAISVPLTGLFALHLHPIIKEAAERRRLFNLKKNKKDQFENLIAERSKLMKFLDDAKNKYCLVQVSN